MTRIKVLHIIKSLGRGGAETLLPETLRLHNKERFDFHYIYFLPWKNQMVESLIANGGRVTCISANNNISLMLKLYEVRAYVQKHRIDVIHAHLPWAGILARLVGKLINVPVIYTEHNKQERYHFVTRILNLLTMNWLIQIIAVSQDVATSIRKHKPALRPDLKVVLNGVNVHHFAPDIFSGNEIRKVLNIPLDSFVVGTIAVFRFQKRLDLWMEIAQRILVKIPKAHFIIVGDGPLRPELEVKRKDLGLEQRIHLVGLQAEIRPYIAGFDIFMMTSIFEGLPIALLETMSSGCPVISTDAGGIKEVIRHDIDGMLCSVENPEALVDFASTLSSSSEKMKQLKEKARKRVADSFGMETMVNELEVLYNRITENNGVYAGKLDR